MKYVKNKYLFTYYLIIQAIHLVMLLIIFVNGFENYIHYLSDDLLQSQRTLLRVSGYIDLVLSTPLGIIGSILVLKSNNRKKILVISLIFLWISALIYELALLFNYPEQFFSINLLFHILFLPVVLLSFRLMRKGEN